MPDGKESGFQPSEREQSIISRQMPKFDLGDEESNESAENAEPVGTAMRRSSEDRESWHEAIGNPDPETIKQIGDLEFNNSTVDGNLRSTFSGEIKGHKVVVSKTFMGTGRTWSYAAELDGHSITNQLKSSELFQRFEDVYNYVQVDKTNIDNITQLKEGEETDQAIQEILGKEYLAKRESEGKIIAEMLSK